MQERSFITTGDGVRIAYRFEGEPGKPVLMLSNSIATTLEMWDGQIPALLRDFRVLRVDTRGHGGSGAPAGAYGLDRLGRDALELLDALGLERVHFCGLSLGGIIGQWLGVHAPERIDRLILAHTAARLGPAEHFDRLITAALEAEDMSAMADMFIGNWFPARLRDDAPETVARFRAMVLATPAQGLAGCFAALRDMDLRRTIALIPRPTLVLGGEHDTVTLARHSEEIAATVPGAKLVLVPAVHLSNVEMPDVFVETLRAFLGVGRK